ncbi:MAG: hypothetical protein Q8P67_24470, partial [archaeon]|nr:hypothetical protein [archaeon]
QHGAALVPVLSFGENDLFAQVPNPKGSGIRGFQERVKSLFGFSPPVFHGRGVFNYAFGLLPFRRPVHTVLGRPIDCPKVEMPSQELIDDYHARYLAGIRALYEAHKERYFCDRVAELEFIE